MTKNFGTNANEVLKLLLKQQVLRICRFKKCEVPKLALHKESFY